MDELNRWYKEFSETPIGAILLFMLVYLSRLAIDQWDRRRARADRPRKARAK